MSKKALPSNVPASHPDEYTEVKGLTLSEIRYRRALVALQKDFCKEKVLLSREKIMNSSPFSKNYKADSDSRFGRAGAIAGKLLGGLNYVDYALAGYSIFNTGKKIFKLFKRK